ncbi:hypothetical protein [Lacticaseibacillus kribbianus]|uniref:hypothetical protein n=1 Tax=Lacticaseibacillus kribbianus TaxID=2926292 RepID=UPI001CD674C9|nr:hypothetical protein [Lacticaseibacillus kribbianus]
MSEVEALIFAAGALVLAVQVLLVALGSGERHALSPRLAGYVLAQAAAVVANGLLIAVFLKVHDFEVGQATNTGRFDLLALATLALFVAGALTYGRRAPR